jgi:hypothetical protein
MNFWRSLTKSWEDLGFSCLFGNCSQTPRYCEVAPVLKVFGIIYYPMDKLKLYEAGKRMKNQRRFEGSYLIHSY